MVRSNGKTEDVQRYISMGVNVDWQDPNPPDCHKNMTALHWAAYHGNVAVVELLLSLNANPNLTDHVRVPPPTRARRALSRSRSPRPLARERESAPDARGPRAFRVARSSRRARGAEARVREREPPPPALSRPRSLLTMSRARASRVQFERTPLFCVCGGHLDVVRALLNAGADKTIADEHGQSIIDSVCTWQDDINNKHNKDAIVALLR